MDIKVLDIQQDKVFFLSKYGKAFGRWRDNLDPERKEYSVEVDYKGVLSSSQMCISDLKCSKIEVVNNTIQITGVVDECDKGYISVQIGNGFINFEIDQSVDGQKICGKYVTISVESIDLYDEHI